MSKSSDEKQIVMPVVNGLLQLVGQSACAKRVVQVISRLIDGRSNSATACAEIEDELKGKGMVADSHRVELCVETAFGLVCGYNQWRNGHESMARWQFPGWELVQLHSRPETIDWPDAWRRHGGCLYSDGRMIALEDSTIWHALSKLELPFPPFDLGSGMRWREIAREEVLALGIISGSETPELTEDDRLNAEQFTEAELNALRIELSGANQYSANVEHQGHLAQAQPAASRSRVDIRTVSLDFAEAIQSRIASLLGSPSVRGNPDQQA